MRSQLLDVNSLFLGLKTFFRYFVYFLKSTQIIEHNIIRSTSKSVE